MAEVTEAAAHTRERVMAAATVVRERFARVPEAGIILGTGMGALASEIVVDAEIEYEAIPGFPQVTVESHTGRLVCGTLGGRTVVAMEGRFHRYEGYSLQEVTFPVRVLRALGARTLLLSGACGGMHPLWAAGDLVMLADHINLLGDNPLIGPNDETLGPRFPDMSEPYDRALRETTRNAARTRGISLREGTYAAVTGPNLETRAEYRLLRLLGADVVGMSTVPEVIVAVHGGMRVLAISVITDLCLPDALEPASFERIVAVARAAEPQLATLMRGVLEEMS